MLNKQGQGKIDWTDYTWNPISGKCHHNCPYCYMHGFWRRYPDMAKPQLKQKYLDEKFPKKPSKIFVGSSTDMWGDWVPVEWIEKVLRKVEENPQHTFQFLTKNPKRYAEFGYLKNAWYGTTIDGTQKASSNDGRLAMFSNKKAIRFISFEPLLAYPDYFHWLALPLFDWIIIGADSTKGAKKPPKEWADRLINKARWYGVPVFVKDNYEYPETIKEFPQEKAGKSLIQ